MKHATRTLSGADLETAVTLAIMSGDQPAMRIIEGGPDESRFYATRDIEGFDGQHGATKREAVMRLFVYESFGDEVEL